jgi:mannose-1-phosphate guanylyltransferase
MKAFVLAAGYGKRLEPLTKAVPKPMVPVANKPIMQYNLELLKRYGIKNVIANIHYFPEQVENYFGDGSKFGLDLQYSYEEELLGTAGGVKRMAEIMKVDSTFMVISSDVLTDINIGRMLAIHKKKKAVATIALTPVRETSQYGVVVLDPNEKITAFQEKPTPETALSDLVNTGIYIFEPEILDLIPKASFYDFGNQVFPELVKNGVAFYGHKMVEYWNDVGGLEKLRSANADLLKGIVRAEVSAKRIDKGTWVGKNTQVDKTAKFEGTIILGDKAVVGRNVQIFGNVSIGDNCVIGDNCIIKDSVIWSDTKIGSSVQMENSIIGSWCILGDNIRIEDGSVLSNRIKIRTGTKLAANTRVEPDKSI